MSDSDPLPNNHLVMSILVTIFCCLPLGVVAIVQSSRVNSLWLAGQHEAALRAAESAQFYSLLGAAIGAFACGTLGTPSLLGL